MKFKIKSLEYSGFFRNSESKTTVFGWVFFSAYVLGLIVIAVIVLLR